MCSPRELSYCSRVSQVTTEALPLEIDCSRWSSPRKRDKLTLPKILQRMTAISQYATNQAYCHTPSWKSRNLILEVPYLLGVYLYLYIVPACTGYTGYGIEDHEKQSAQWRIVAKYLNIGCTSSTTLPRSFSYIFRFSVANLDFFFFELSKN